MTKKKVVIKINLLILGLIKIFDNIISTAKTISVQKDRRVLSSVLVVISQFSFYFVIDKIVDDTSVIPILVLSICSGLGTYLAFYINDKYEKDMLYTNIITSSNIEDIKELCDVLKKNKIKHIINDGYTRNWDKTYNVLVFAVNKSQSKVIDGYLKCKTKFFREILK